MRLSSQQSTCTRTITTAARSRERGRQKDERKRKESTRREPTPTPNPIFLASHIRVISCHAARKIDFRLVWVQIMTWIFKTKTMVFQGNYTKKTQKPFLYFSKTGEKELLPKIRVARPNLNSTYNNNPLSLNKTCGTELRRDNGWDSWGPLYKVLFLFQFCLVLPRFCFCFVYPSRLEFWFVK